MPVGRLVFLRGHGSFPAAAGRDLMFRSLHGVIRLKYAGVAPNITKSFLQ